MRIQPRLIAKITAIVRSFTWSLERIEVIWFFTVWPLIESSLAISLLESPAGDTVEDLDLAAG